ncbi:MAG: thiamine pyrophosphate-dependent dehydrogenase E1 component subunit alpha [Firmicutes bacterium]|nr:thiamine pyrophosphate-dependent dehydrogenase E1 component subunit alpha [Alicyclobacillaceae bacterium]MCL6496501.1 thiamine pyrophosphate-dependent dehydrogenase E1 component subunit alpha [Bacillota bacterium]
MYRRILRIRYFDEAAVELVRQGELPGVAHTTIGQEAEVVGACMAVRVDDYMVGNHRSHGHPIGKGADMKRLMAELLGKVTGVNRGKGGSMHLADFSVGSVGETSIVGSGVPVAAGAALAARMLGTDRVCLCFFGDGATNEGAFHEGLNLAAIWKLPVIYLCENNQYAVTTPAAEVVAVRNIADRARAYDIPGVVVDGQDPVAVYEVVSEAVQRARQGLGPSLIEAKTYRYLEHAEGLPIAAQYRTAEEVAAWKARDPVVTFRQRLIQEGVATPEALDQVVAAVRAEVAEAVAYARSSPYPDPEEAFTGVYSTPVGGVR